MKIYAYVYRDGRNCFLPRDVLDALGEPIYVRQGSVYVFAPTAESALRRLNTLDLGPRSTRDLARVNDGRVFESLVRAGLGTDGAVYAMGLSKSMVVWIRQDTSDRLIDRVGEIRASGFMPTDALSAEVAFERWRQDPTHENRLAAIAALQAVQDKE